MRATEDESTLEDCQRFYSDYGARTGDRAPLYYDLPECVAAFEYRQSYAIERNQEHM